MADRVLDVTDPVALRALAHPVRLRLLRLVREHGPVTGAQLAERLGESTASVSYHLSVLARHGFVEPDPTPGPTRRHKPWRTTYDRLRMSAEESATAPLDSPGGAVLASLLADSRAEQDAYLAGGLAAAGAEAAQVADAAVFNLSHLVLTEAEAEQLAAEVSDVVGRYRSEGRPAPGEGRFAVSFVVVPVVPEEPLS
jgi:DNA-binding transcriptional ArsR family regulator